MLSELGVDEVDKPTMKNAVGTAIVVVAPCRATGADI